MRCYFCKSLTGHLFLILYFNFYTSTQTMNLVAPSNSSRSLISIHNQSHFPIKKYNHLQPPAEYIFHISIESIRKPHPHHSPNLTIPKLFSALPSNFKIPTSSTLHSTKHHLQPSPALNPLNLHNRPRNKAGGFNPYPEHKQYQ